MYILPVKISELCRVRMCEVLSLFYFLNILISIVMLALGGHIKYSISRLENIYAGYDDNTVPYLLVAVGIISLITNVLTGLACFTAQFPKRRTQCLVPLKALGGTNLVLAVTIFAASLMCFSTTRHLENAFKRGIKHGMAGYPTSEKTKAEMDQLQMTYKCCGNDDYNDWFAVGWMLDKYKDPVHGESIPAHVISAPVKKAMEEVPFEEQAAESAALRASAPMKHEPQKPPPPPASTKIESKPELNNQNLHQIGKQSPVVHKSVTSKRSKSKRVKKNKAKKIENLEESSASQANIANTAQVENEPSTIVNSPKQEPLRRLMRRLRRHKRHADVGGGVNITRDMTQDKTQPPEAASLQDSVPFSCCDPKSVRPCINTHVTQNNLHRDYDHVAAHTLYTKGCTEAVMSYYGDVLLQAGGAVVFVVFIVQLVLILFTNYLETSMQKAIDEGHMQLTAEGYLLHLPCITPKEKEDKPKNGKKKSKKGSSNSRTSQHDPQYYQDPGFGTDEFDDSEHNMEGMGGGQGPGGTVPLPQRPPAIPRVSSRRGQM